MNLEEMGSTNIRVSTRTRDRIAKHFCKYGDSMDTILNRILDDYEARHPEEEKK